MKQFDVVVIGAGPGGYPAAIRAAQLGATVAVVEREQLGGTCLNWGCIPTKLYIGAAQLFHELRHAARLGIKAENLTVDFACLAAHKDQAVARLRGGISQLLKANKIEFFSGSASFQSRDRIAVSSSAAGTVELTAKNFIIATGSTSLMPESFPSNPRVLDSRGFLALKELPRSLLVMGGGYIGCELAGAAAQLGLEVTLVELLEDILLGFNQDVRREVRKALETLVGVRILTGQPLTEVQCQGDRVAGVCGDKRLEADMILVAIGRKPFTAGLELERAGLHTNAHGFLEVNDFGQTPVSGIYAVGDVNGRMPLAHAATSQGITAAENACGLPPRAFETVVPGVVFTSPEVGVVGLSEEEAKQRGIPVAVGRFGFGALGRTVASGQTIGFAKWIAQPDTHVLLGAAVVGPHATELIAEAAVAIRARLKVADLATTIHAHPTFGEIWMEAAHAVERRAIHGAPARRS